MRGGGGEEGSKAAVDVSDAAGASTSGAGEGSSSAAEGADGAPLKTPRATGFGSGVLPGQLCSRMHTKRRPTGRGGERRIF